MMIRNKERGFTLVELLAVIAILGLILIIAIPKVMETLNNQKKRTLELNARAIIKAGEEKYLENSAYGIEEEITCEGVSNIVASDIQSCNITFDDSGNAKVTIIGKGRYDGLNVCNGTRTSVIATEDSCVTYNLGDVVYYNPVANKMCTDYVDTNSETDNTDGCLKWYVYNVDSNKTKLILDHNINIIKDKRSNIYLLTLVEESNTKSMVSLFAENAFYQEIKNWQPSVSIISDEDVLKLMPWYNNLQNKSNWYTSYNNIIGEMYDEVYRNYETDEQRSSAMYELANQNGILLPDYLMINFENYMIDNVNESQPLFFGHPESDDWYIPIFDEYTQPKYASIRPTIELNNGNVKLLDNKENVVIEELYVPKGYNGSLDYSYSNTIDEYVPILVKPSYANRNSITYSSSNNYYSIASDGLITYTKGSVCGDSTTITITTIDASNITKEINIGHATNPC